MQEKLTDTEGLVRWGDGKVFPYLSRFSLSSLSLCLFMECSLAGIVFLLLFQIARDCANTMTCETAVENCKQAKEARTGDCDVTCCAGDLCNAGSIKSPLLWLSVLSFIAYEVLVNFHCP